MRALRFIPRPECFPSLWSHAPPTPPLPRPRPLPCPGCLIIPATIQAAARHRTAGALQTPISGPPRTLSTPLGPGGSLSSRPRPRQPGPPTCAFSTRMPISSIVPKPPNAAGPEPVTASAAATGSPDRVHSGKCSSGLGTHSSGARVSRGQQDRGPREGSASKWAWRSPRLRGARAARVRSSAWRSPLPGPRRFLVVWAVEGAVVSHSVQSRMFLEVWENLGSMVKPPQTSGDLAQWGCQH